MPRGIPNNPKKKAAKKPAKRAYTRRSISSLVEKITTAPNQQSPAVPRKATVKDAIIMVLKKHHVHHVDMDGHLSLAGKMIETDVLVELMAVGAQAICARYNMDTKNPYLAVYY